METSDNTIENYAIVRAGRITTRATEGPFDDDLAGWLLASLQRWWMAHGYYVAAPSVAEHFCTAVDTALPHLNRDRMFQALARGILSDVRAGGPNARASAKGLIVLLGLDPDASPLSLLLFEWERLTEALDGESSRVAAEHISVMIRQVVNLVADPETMPEQRSELVAAAITSLGTVAYGRESENDLWLAVGDFCSVWGADGEAALVARLVLCAELLELVARDSTQ